MKIVLTDKLNGGKIIGDLEGAVIESAVDGSTKIIFSNGTGREVVESIDDLEKIMGVVSVPAHIAALVKPAKKKR